MNERTPTDIAVQLNECHNAIVALSKRLDKAEQIIEQIRELNTTTQLIAQKQNAIEDNINALSQTVRDLDNQPKEKWNKATWIVIISAISNFIK